MEAKAPQLRESAPHNMPYVIARGLWPPEAHLRPRSFVLGMWGGTPVARVLALLRPLRQTSPLVYFL